VLAQHRQQRQRHTNEAGRAHPCSRHGGHSRATCRAI
jgi:hypothetical protein